MIYTPLTKKALRIAYDAHHGQRDKSGGPYIFHPYHLAEQMKDEITTCVALLHDVAEDTEITFQQLAKEFPEEIIVPLKLLTHEKGADYLEYIENLRKDPVAKAVKLADLEHNSDQSRFCDGDAISAKQREYLRNKYRQAKEILLSED